MLHTPSLNLLFVGSLLLLYFSLPFPPPVSFPPFPPFFDFRQGDQLNLV